MSFTPRKHYRPFSYNDPSSDQYDISSDGYKLMITQCKTTKKSLFIEVLLYC